VHGNGFDDLIIGADPHGDRSGASHVVSDRIQYPARSLSDRILPITWLVEISRICSTGGGNDILDCRGDATRCSAVQATTPMWSTVPGTRRPRPLAAATPVKVGGVNEDAIRNIEDVTGGTAADRSTGDGPSNTLRSGLGADILNGDRRSLGAG